MQSKDKLVTISNGNWVCFDCRKSRRIAYSRFVTFLRSWIIGSVGDRSITCTSCQKPCRFLGHRIDIPDERDDRGWRKLAASINETYSMQRDGMAKLDTRRKHQIERRIIELQERPANADRDELILELQTELKELNRN